jgi:AcrR family transcriptional regulator
LADAETPERGGTRRRLLEAAIEMIGEAGWGGVTTRAVAERAGVNQALVHYHYRSVPGLLREAAYAAMSAVFEPVMLRLVETEDPEAALRGMCEALMDIDPDAPEARAVVEATVQAMREQELGAQVRQMLALFRQELAQRLAASQAGGHLPADVEPAALATALVALLDGLALHRLIDPDLNIGAASTAVLTVLRRAGEAGHETEQEV